MIRMFQGVPSLPVSLKEDRCARRYTTQDMAACVCGVHGRGHSWFRLHGNIGFWQ